MMIRQASADDRRVGMWRRDRTIASNPSSNPKADGEDERYIVELVALPARPGEPDGVYRLRRGLKLLLRRFRLRCVRIERVEGTARRELSP